ncbi:MAG: diadenylate cyclase CdaA [bacterium]|nr:diadenylate cyclase CdaA [bacterium]
MYKLIHSIRILDVIDISIVSIVIYHVFIIIRGTVAIQTLKGLFILIILFFVSSRCHLNTIYWILKNFWTIGLVAFVIVFQPEIRRALSHMGQRQLWLKGFFRREEELVQEVVKAARILVGERIGALIVFERNIGLKNYIESGIKINSRVSAELIMTIFYPGTPLHDGAIIIKEEQIAAACCFLPLSQNPDLTSVLGTRHRAAIGLSEETDALIIIISEETGFISLAMGGKLIRRIDEETLIEMLTLYASTTKEETFKFRDLKESKW